VTDVQTIVLHTQNINGDGLPHGDVSFSFLMGDVNGTNFRDDINRNGRVDRPDYTVVQANRGHHLP
jgi:hypothetical protein